MRIDRESQFSFKWIHLAMAICIFCCLFVFGFYGSLYFRQLENDGARWAAQLFASATWVRDLPFLRFSGLVMETPAVVLAKLGMSLRTVVTAFCFTFFVYPFLAMIYAWKKKDGKFDSEYFFFSFFIVLFCMVPTWGFPASTVNDAITIGLLFFTYLMFNPRLNVWIYSLFTVALCFTYDLAIFYIALSALFVLFEKRKPTSFFWISLGGLAFCIWNLFFRILSEGHQSTFNSALLQWNYSAQLINFLAAMILMLISFFLRHRIIQWLASLSAFILLIFELSSFVEFDRYDQSYFNRTWCLLAASLLFIFYYLSKKFGRTLFQTHILSGLLCLALANLVFENRQILRRVQNTQKLRTALQSHIGCHFLNKQDEIEKVGLNWPQDPGFLPILSLLNQETSKIRTIFFSHLNIPQPKTCGIVDKELFLAQTQVWSIFVWTGGNFDFSQVKN